MQVQLARFNQLCLDAAGFVSLQAVRNACALGTTHAFSFYVGNKYGVTKEHVKIAFDNGMLVSPNREGDSHEAFNWSSGPVREIDQTRLILDSWGLDWRNVPTIDSAVDWNPLASEYARCDQWWHLYVDHAREIGFWGGYYGATAYGAHLIAQDWWPEDFPTWTWGGSGTIPGTNMKQFVGYPSGNDYSSIGATVDESQVRAGLWMASSFESAPPPATQGVPDMPTLLTNSEPYPQFPAAAALGYIPPDGVNWPTGWLWFERMPGGGKKWLYGEDFQAAYDFCVLNNIQGIKRTTGQLQAIPDYVAASGTQGPQGLPGAQGSIGPQGIPGPPGPAPHGTFPGTVTIP